MEPQVTPKEEDSGKPTWEQLEEIRSDENLRTLAPGVLSKSLQGSNAAVRAQEMVDGPPQRHIDYLRENPDDEKFRQMFDDTYGVGAAKANRVTWGDYAVDTALAVPRGLAGFLDETAQSLEEAVEGGLEYFDIKPDFLDSDFFNAGDAARDLTGTAETAPGKFVEGASQFFGGYALAAPLKALNGAFKGSKFAVAMARGAFSDAFAFDPDDPLVVEALEEFGIDTQGFKEWLVSEDDGDWERRAKRALEGAGIGVVADAVMAALKLGKKAFLDKPISEAEKAQVKKVAEQALKEAQVKVKEAQIKVEEETTLSKTREVIEETVEEVTPAADQRLVVTPEELDATIESAAAGARSASMEGVPEYLVDARTAANEAAAEMWESRGTNKGMNDTLFMSSLRETFDSFDNDATYVSFGSTREELLPKAREFAQQIIEKMNSGENVQNLVDMINENVPVKDLGALNFASKIAVDAVDLHRKALKQAMDKALAEKDMEVVLALTDEYDANLARWLELTQFDAELGSLSGSILQSRQAKPSKFSEKLAANLNLTDAPLEKTIEKKRAKVTKQTFMLDQITRLRKMGINIRDAEEIVDEILKGSDGQELAKRAYTKEKAEGIRQIFEGINEYRTSAGLLSGPKTMEINLATAGIMTAINPLIEGAGKAVSFEKGALSHVTNQYAGMAHNLTRAIREAGIAFKTGETRVTGSGSRAENNATDIIPNKLGGPLWRVFGRILVATDTAFKELNYGAAVSLEANKAASAKGLKGKERDAFLRQYLEASYDKDGWGINPQARELAEIRTFTKDFDAKSQYGMERLLASGQSVLNWHPSMRIIITPFYRTPMRLLEQGMRLSPGFNLIGSRYRHDLLGHNGAMAKYRARGEMMAGMAYVTTAWTLAEQGLITGSYDREDREFYKETNIPAESIKINGEWYNYSQWEPFATPLRMIATVVERKNKMMANSYDRYISHQQQIDNVLSSAFMSFVGSTTSSPMMEGFDKWLTFAGDVSSGDSKVGEELIRMLAREAGTLIPNIAKKGMMLDNEFEQEKTSATGSVFTDTLFKGLEGYLDLVPNDTVRDRLGNRIETTPAADWLITAARNPNDNPVLEEIFTAEKFSGMSFSFPSEKKDGINLAKYTAKAPRTDKAGNVLEGNAGVRSAYDRWKELSGTVVYNGKTLEEALSAAFQSNAYKDGGYGANGKPGPRTEIMGSIINAYREAAYYTLIQENPELQYVLPAEVIAKARAFKLSPNLVDEKLLPEFLRN